MRRFFISFVAVSLLSASPSFGAHPRIDQEQPAVNNAGPAINFGAVDGPITATETKLAQVFTAGIYGAITHVTLPLACSANAKLRVSIHSVAGGLPSTVVISSDVMSGATYPPYTAPYSVFPDAGFRLVQFSKPAQVAAGDQYAIVVSAFGKCVILAAPDGDSYIDGRGYYESSLSRTPGWIPLGPPMDDLPFQTFVDPEGYVEPIE